MIKGVGSLKNIDSLDIFNHAKTIMLVTGKASYEQCGAAKILNEKLKNKNVIHFSQFSVNPKSIDVTKGVLDASGKDLDLIIGLGGGSVMDMAKLIKACGRLVSGADEIITKNLSDSLLDVPMVLIPTTAGSGSEATHFAVGYVEGSKFSLALPALLPDEVVLDGSLVMSSSSYQLACNGLDAMAQAIESCWALEGTHLSRRYAFEALEKSFNFLPKVLSKNATVEDFQVMLEAAHIAGKAINISKTTAPHAFSYAFTSELGVPHGHAVWLTLPKIFQIHATSDRSIKLSCGIKLSNVMNQMLEILGIKSPENSANQLMSFIRSLGVNPSFDSVGADSIETRSLLAKKVNLERLSNNPVVLSDDDLSLIFNL